MTTFHAAGQRSDSQFVSVRTCFWQTIKIFCWAAIPVSWDIRLLNRHNCSHRYIYMCCCTVSSTHQSMKANIVCCAALVSGSDLCRHWCRGVFVTTTTQCWRVPSPCHWLHTGQPVSSARHCRRPRPTWMYLSTAA